MRGLAINDWQVAMAGPGDELVVDAAPRVPRPPDGTPSVAPALALARRLADAAGQDTGLWVAVPSHLARDALPLLLTELRKVKYHVHGFADSATVLAATLARPGNAVIVEAGARSMLLRIVACVDGEASLQRSAALPVGGADLHDAWVQRVAEAMVRQWRFDPLDDPGDEQRLRAQLPALLQRAADTGTATFALQSDGRALAVTLSRDQFREAVATLVQPLQEALQALCAFATDAPLWVPQELAHWPGLQEALRQAGATVVHGLAPGAAARAVARLPAPASGGIIAVPWFTRLSAQEAAAPEDFLLPLPAALPVRDVVAPTHVVFAGRAVAIDEVGVVLGREPGDEPHGLRLPGGVAGLSRRHCTLRRVQDKVVLVDHSRHGSFVDGLRVDRRAVLGAGSTLRLGTPGVEMALVVVDPFAGE